MHEIFLLDWEIGLFWERLWELDWLVDLVRL
jgi:hypothetical protein